MRHFHTGCQNSPGPILGAHTNPIMRAITIKGLSLQFDADQITNGSVKKQAEQAIHEINLVLQRQPFCLGAQIISPKKLNATASKIDAG